ncbi:AAA family ATPase [Stenotrophomonas pigmentata]|uniref:AAA family ATPase n=1 Tax=Stenotrophomonas pigmentata TaxID=3055080 RepID=UPI0026EE4FD3|nr:AAA family ATPase [Stenotrophomonas sp. 610A2]
MGVSNFTWIPVFRAVAEWVGGFEARQPELIQVLKEVGIDAGLEDKDENAQTIPLQAIDPFTFFCMFMKYGVERRKQLFARLIDVAGLSVVPPTDFDGVPSANAMKVWMFPYQRKREDWMIPTLWMLFKDARTGLDADTFARALKIPSTGFTKLTQALFYVAPDLYFPIDRQTRPWLLTIGVPRPERTLPAYLAALDAVRKHSSEPFAALSHGAWENNQGAPFDAQVAMDYLDERYPDTYSGTSHIAAYRTGTERQLAFDPGTNPAKKSTLQVFVDARPSRVSDDRMGEYLPEKSRNHHLGSHAPRLATGQPAYTVRVSSLEELVELCSWYDSKPAATPPALPTSEPAMITQPLNQILYGPPGTGKTYATIDKALAILEPDFNGSREQKKQKFDAYAAAGQIKFVTFHQSFSYEDFVEGIRAGTNEATRQIEYAVEDGVFKQLCNAARRRVVQSTGKHIDLKGRRIWKISLGEAGTEEAVYEDCIRQGLALIGFGADADYNGVQTRDDIAQRFQQATPERDASDYPITALNIFIRQVKVGDLFVVTQGNLRFRAIGEVTSEYLHVPRENDSYSQGRKVNWLRVYDAGLPYAELMENRFSQMTIYELRPGSINLDKLAKLLAPVEETQDNAPRVLIIDEINRGNISRIFGELITLIEESKRAGKAEALQVTLPYSQDKFSVPDNVYLIGTMNTADRSLAGLDVALRRRFVFEEMPPRPGLLGMVSGIDLQQLLAVMNNRIEVLLGRDHLLGHAYFIGIQSLDELKRVFQLQILPLLQEYFFEDWERIALVLNDPRKAKVHQFLSKPVYDEHALFGKAGFGNGSRWQINDEAFEEPESYLGIYTLIEAIQ